MKKGFKIFTLVLDVFIEIALFVYKILKAIYKLFEECAK